MNNKKINDEITKMKHLKPFCFENEEAPEGETFWIEKFFCFTLLNSAKYSSIGREEITLNGVVVKIKSASVLLFRLLLVDGGFVAKSSSRL